MVERGEGRVRLGISVEKETFLQLEDFCKKHYNSERSKVIEEALKKFLQEKQK